MPEVGFLTVFLLGYFQCLACQISSLVQKPFNLVGVIGQRIEVKPCSTYSEEGGKEWLEHITNIEGKRIILNGAVANEKYEAIKYKNFAIKKVEQGDAGTYSCRIPSSMIQYFIYLAVIENDMQCSIYEGDGLLQVGNYSKAKCEMNFYGEVAPVIKWSSNLDKNLPSDLKTNTNNITSSMAFIAGEGFKRVQFTADCGFPGLPKELIPKGNDEIGFSEEQPNYSYTWKSAAMPIHYEATKPQFNIKGRIKVGQTIICNSTANPGPVNISMLILFSFGGKRKEESNELKITKKLRGSFMVTCMASSPLHNSSNTEVYFVHHPSDRILPSLTLALGIAASLVGIIAIYIARKDAKDPVSVDSYRMKEKVEAPKKIGGPPTKEKEGTKVHMMSTKTPKNQL